MSKNTANIAQAISLLSDVLSREAVTETEATETDPFDDSQASEFDDLKHQALEFGQEVVDDLDVISDELDRTLEANEFDAADDDDDDDDDIWQVADDDDNDSEVDDGDEDAAESADAESDVETAADGDDDNKSEPTPDESTDKSGTTSELTGTDEVEALQNITAALEKSNEDLTDKVDDLTEALQHIDTLIDDLSVTAKEFVSEVETL